MSNMQKYARNMYTIQIICLYKKYTCFESPNPKINFHFGSISLSTFSIADMM